MDLLSDFDIAVLRAAWRVLSDLGDASNALTSDAADKWDGAKIGRMAEATEGATTALFNALVVLGTRLDDPRADRATEDAAPPNLRTARDELRAVLLPPGVHARARALLELAAEAGDDHNERGPAARSAIASCGVELAQLLYRDALAPVG